MSPSSCPQRQPDKPGPTRRKPRRAQGSYTTSRDTIDGGLVLLREAERSLRLAETLAGCIRDRRNQAQVVHSLSAMLRFRMLAIACGYEDADDCDALRAAPCSCMDAPVRARGL